MIKKVIECGYCIGCGACNAKNSSLHAPIMDKHGQLVAARLDEREVATASAVCPFSADAADEDQISAGLFPGIPYRDEYLGRYYQLYAGFVACDEFRASGSSGGLGKWLLAELLSQDRVDAVIQVVSQPEGGNGRELFSYAVMTQPDQIQLGSKSAYYPIEMSGVLEYVRAHPGRYAITGVPCFVKAIRLLARTEAVFKDRIRFCVGMFCGHLKSTAYAELLAWQMGISPDDLVSIDFRGKIAGKPANAKGVFARSRCDPGTVVGPAVSRELFGGGYNLGFFQYKACDYCDDVVAETADVSIGDAWLPEYIKDEQGTSIVILRNPEISALIHDGIADGRLALEPISAKKVIQSQLGGLRHRREGLAYRLKLADERGEWRPRKRVEARSRGLSRKRKAIYRLRMQLREQSHAAFQRAKQFENLQQFITEMEPLVTEYQTHYRPGKLHRIKRGLQRRLNWLLALVTRELPR